MPGTNLRFGWDPIIGLVPGLGDLLTALFSCAILIEAHRSRVPRVIQVRMLFNTAFDLALGIVPVVGDVGDLVWKSSAKNFALLERHATTPARPSIGDWVFVGSVLTVLALVAVLPLVVVYWLYLSLTAR